MRLKPRPTPEALPFWEGTAIGELRMQFCNGCERYFYYPRLRCRYCDSPDVEWRALSGGGRLISYVIDCRPETGSEAEPAAIAIVEVSEGPRLTTNLVGIPDGVLDVPLDSPVQVEFLPGDGYVLPVFRLSGLSTSACASL